MARRRKRTAGEISTTPEARAVRHAVGIIGGSAKAGKLVGRCEQAVQKWMEDPTRMSAENTRILSKGTHFEVPVAQMRPDLYGGLTVQELGYLPPAYKKGKA